jgi:hypothetical protein
VNPVRRAGNGGAVVDVVAEVVIEHLHGSCLSGFLLE